MYRKQAYKLGRALLVGGQATSFLADDSNMLAGEKLSRSLGVKGFSSLEAGSFNSDITGKAGR